MSINPGATTRPWAEIIGAPSGGGTDDIFPSTTYKSATSFRPVAGSIIFPSRIVSVPSCISGDVVTVQNGPPAKRSEPNLPKEGASAAADVTDERRRRRLIFNATRRDAAGWRFFCVARSARMNSDMGASLGPRKTANRPAAASPVYARRHNGSFIEFCGPLWNRDKELPSGPLVRW